MLTHLFNGFCMALADSVPGVSGGTVAFILGFYEHFLGALHQLVQGKNTERKEAFLYLLKLGVGWCGGMICSVLVLAQLFNTQIYVLSSLFLGLMLAALPFIIAGERKNMAVTWQNLLCCVLGLALVCGLTLFRASSASSGAIDYLALQPLQYLYLFAAGMLAIAAMVLPGISGSTLLLIFGVYVPTIHAANDLLTGNFEVLPGLIALGLGILCGAAVSVHFIRSAFRHHRPQMLYLILGLMLGSFYAICMGPTTLPVPQSPLTLSNFEPLGFMLGIAVLLGLEKLKAVSAKHEICRQPYSSRALPQCEHD